MNYKTIDPLSDYLLLPTGEVMEISTSSIVEPIPSRLVLKQFKLLTDEIMPHTANKKKPTRIVRRFTKEDIIKLYNNPRAKVFGDADPVSAVEKQNDPDEHEKNVSIPDVITGFKVPYLLIKGIQYQSSRDAAKDIGGNYNTILRKCKANKDGYFYIEK